MKLVHCHACGDIFNLQMREKSCHCGCVKGRYVDVRNAEVSGAHTAIAIGNGSYNLAIFSMHQDTADWRDDSRHEKVMKLFGSLRELVPSMFIAWTRPASGPTNPHSVKKDDQ